MTAVDRSRLPPLGPDPFFQFPRFDKLRLANGIRVWAVEHRTLPVVSVVVLVPAGAAADPQRQHGLAALTADLLDEGSGGRSTLEFHQAIERIGGRLDIDIGPDATIAAFTTLSRHIAAGLSLLADAVQRPNLEWADFDRARTLRLTRLTQLRDVPSAVADRLLARVLFRDHPYGHTPLGNEAALKGIALTDVAAFHRCAFRPDTATIIIVGAATTSELTEAVERTFGAWTVQDAAADFIQSADAAPLPAQARTTVLTHKPGAAQSELRVAQIAARRSAPEYPALVVLNTILGGQFVSRINMNLREDKGFTYGARSTFDCRRAPGPFVVQVSVQTDATAAALLEIHRELSAIRGERPATESELRLARASVTRGFPRSFETTEQVAAAATQLAMYDLPDDYFERFIAAVRAVDERAVTAAANRFIDPDRLTTVIVSDRDRITGLTEAGFAPVEEMDAV